jgi:hypothetical protein
MVTNINNEAANSVALYGTEIIPGQAVTPTAMLNGTFEASGARGAVRRREQATGGYDRVTRASRERGAPSGNYGSDLTFEEFAALLRYSVAGGAAGVQIGTSGAYRHRKVPTFNVDDIETMTVVSGIEGKAYQSTGVRFNEFTVTVDATDQDNAWKWASSLFLRDRKRLPGSWTGVVTSATATELTVTGAGWTIDAWEGCYVTIDYGTHMGEVRMAEGNTATVLTLEQALSSVPQAGTRIHIAAPLPVVPDILGEPIPVEGTRLLLGRYNASDPFGDLVDVSERMVMASISQELNLAPKWRFPGMIGRSGRGARWIVGTLRLEDDLWDEDEAWENDERLTIRLEQEGPEIGTTGENYLARIDVEKAIFSTITPDTDQNNMTKSIAFLAEVPLAGDIAGFEAVTGQAVLP